MRLLIQLLADHTFTIVLQPHNWGVWLASTSEIRTTSQQRARVLPPMYPLFRDSTVQSFITNFNLSVLKVLVLSTWKGPRIPTFGVVTSTILVMMPKFNYQPTTWLAYVLVPHAHLCDTSVWLLQEFDLVVSQVITSFSSMSWNRTVLTVLGWLATTHSHVRVHVYWLLYLYHIRSIWREGAYI